MISIVIPTHGRPDLLHQTLSSITSCELPDTYHKLIVVENGSRLGAEDLVSALPNRLRAEYMHLEWGNKSNALNKALEQLENDLVFFTDDDVRLHHEVLLAYEKAAAGYQNNVFLGGPVKVDREEEPPKWMEPLLPFSARGYDLKNERMHSGYLGFNWAAFAQDIKQLGGFDPRYGPGSTTGASGQETDMQRRMRNAGFAEVDVLDALVWHKVPASRCNEEWLQQRFFKVGLSKAVKKNSVKDIVSNFFEFIKYSIRWTLYLTMFNKVERKKSKMEVIDRLGYFYALLK